MCSMYVFCVVAGPGVECWGKECEKGGTKSYAAEAIACLEGGEVISAFENVFESGQKREEENIKEN